MSALSEFLGACSLHLPDENLILYRLLGRPFAMPFSDVLGEQSEDALRSFLVDAKIKPKSDQINISQPFVALIGCLLGGSISAAANVPLEALTAPLREETRSLLAFRLIRILEDAGVEVDGLEFAKLVQQFNPGPKLSGPALSTYWHLVLSRFANNFIGDHQISISLQIVTDLHFINGPLIVMASARPQLFLGSVAPMLFEALRSRMTKQKILLEPIGHAMRAAFQTLYQNGRNTTRRRELLELFAADLRILVAARHYDRTAKAVLAAAAEATNIQARFARLPLEAPSSGMPFADFTLLQSAYSAGRARVVEAKVFGDTKLASLLEGYIKPVRTRAIGSQVDPVLATNLIPYSEGIYFLIWKQLLYETGISLELKHYEWGNVIPSVLNGRLSFAVLNDYVPEEYQDDTKTRLSTQPMLVYDNYPLIARRDVLERICEKLPVEESNIVIDVLTGGEPLDVEKLAKTPTLLMKLQRFPLGLVEHSEILEVARSHLGNVTVNGMSSDVAVEKIVDGVLVWAIVGGVQAYYLARHFRKSVVMLASVPRPTPVLLWFNEKTFDDRKYANFLGPLLEAWRQTCRIWDNAKRDNAESKHLRAWITNIAFQLNAGVGIEAQSLRTPIESWEELAELQQKHDQLHQPTNLEAPGARSPAQEAAEQTSVSKMSHIPETGRAAIRLVVNNKPRSA